MTKVESWLAVYGAVVASVALGWQIWTAASDRPDLRVSASAPSKVVPPTASRRENPWFWVTYPVAFFNAGGRPVTIISGDFQLSLEPIVPSDAGLVNEGDSVQQIPARFLPITLAPGDARTITLNLKLEAQPAQAFLQGYRGQFVFQLETTTGAVRRKCDFILDALVLNKALAFPD